MDNGSHSPPAVTASRTPDKSFASIPTEVGLKALPAGPSVTPSRVLPAQMPCTSIRKWKTAKPRSAGSRASKSAQTAVGQGRLHLFHQSAADRGKRRIGNLSGACTLDV